MPTLGLPVCDTVRTNEELAGRAGGAVVGDGTWLTVSETVARLGGIVGEQTVRRMCADGTLESVRLGGSSGHRRILASSVDAYLAELKAQGAQSDDTGQ